MSAPACSPSIAWPVSTPRRNQRGPSTPRNRAGRCPLRPSGRRTGRRASSSSPNGPVRSWVEPPCLATCAASSPRRSSQSPSERGAANACNCSEDPSKAALTATTRRVFLSTSMRICRPGRLGTRRAPRSIREPSSGSSVTSHGPISSPTGPSSASSAAGCSVSPSVSGTSAGLPADVAASAARSACSPVRLRRNSAIIHVLPSLRARWSRSRRRRVHCRAGVPPR